MNSIVAVYSLFILAGTLISSISQVMLKKAAMKEYSTKIREYLNPLVITAYCIMLAASLFTVIAYKQVPLSLGPVLESTSYIYVTLFGIILFKEKMNKRKIIALALIVGGIIVAA